MSPSEKATSSLELQRARGDCQHLLATLLEKRLLLSLFFFLFSVERVVAKAEGCSHAVDLAYTYAQVKTLSQFHLDVGTSTLWQRTIHDRIGGKDEGGSIDAKASH